MVRDARDDLVRAVVEVVRRDRGTKIRGGSPVIRNGDFSAGTGNAFIMNRTR